MKVGYVRVSTINQNPARQEQILVELGAEKIFIDKTSGKNTDRPEFVKMMDFVREGDTLIVESYSRLARSTADLLRIVDTLKEKGVIFVSQKESLDTATPQGRLMLSLFASIYEFERECMLQRQREGVEIARAAGKYGRNKIEVDRDKFKKVYSTWKDGGITAVEAMKRLNLKKTTFYKLVAEHEKRP